MTIISRLFTTVLLCGVLLNAGCQSTKQPASPQVAHREPASKVDVETRSPNSDPDDQFSSAEETGETALSLVSLEEPVLLPLPEGEEAEVAYELDDVINSVYTSYPLLKAALYNRNIAQGNYLSAQGNFDLKFKSASENGPTGYYQTYRNSVGVEQPMMWGGSVFGGYRIGRGDFQPWYQERQTNDGGEFKAGVSVPLLRNRDIDARRAELWNSAWGTHIVEPQIQQELIDFIFMASDAYWTWVAAGQKYQIQKQLLELAITRNKGIEREVQLGSRDPPDLEDNKRLIVSREAKVIAARQKFQQASYKLSIFLRDANGEPIVLGDDKLPTFPELPGNDLPTLETDIQTAYANRPELREIEILRKQVNIERNLAVNDALPNVDAVLLGSQDVGEPTSSKRDKSQFELEAAIMVDVPLQRRKARGKQQSLAGKASQLVVKTGMIQDKIVAEIQNVHAGLTATYETVLRARESVRLARYMAEVERKKFLAGSSDLLSLNLREQQAASAAETEVEALQEYFRARAAYRAVLAEDDLSGRVR
ncbi:MAG: TolC family protein [Planctomycetaceae bacterium]|nr:TolC family protein [Planctomycetaceae bacterium]